MPHRIINGAKEEVYHGTKPHEYELEQDHKLVLYSVQVQARGSREPIHKITTHQIVYCQTLYEERLAAEAEAEAEERAAAIAELTATVEALTVKELREQVKQINEARPETLYVSSKAKKAVLVTAITDCLVGLADAGLTDVRNGNLVVISFEQEERYKKLAAQERERKMSDGEE